MALRYQTKVLPMQAEVLSYDGIAAGLRGAVRSGKTYALQNWMHDRMERYPRARHAVMGANLPQLKGGALRDFCTMMDKYKIEYDYRSTDGLVTLRHNGAKLWALSADVGQRILSHSYDTLWLEEPQTWNNAEETYYSLMTRLSKSAEGMQWYPEMQPQMRLSFNPRQTFVGHWLWKLITEKKALPEFVFRTRDNFLMNYPGGVNAYVHWVKSQLPEELWKVDLDGEWATFGGGVYRYYRRDIHNDPVGGLPPYGFDPSLPLLWSLDFNVDFMCSIVAQIHTQRAIVEYDGGQPRTRLPMPGWQEQIIYVLDEIRLTENADSHKAVEAFIGKYGERAKKVGVCLYGDASGTGRSSTSNSTLSGRSNWHIVVEALTRADIPWKWRVQRQNPPVVDRVNNTNLYFWSADGPGIVVNDGCAPFLVQDLQSVQWIEGKYEIDKKTDPKLTHLSDALGYLCWFSRMSRMGHVALRDLEGINLMGR